MANDFNEKVIGVLLTVGGVLAVFFVGRAILDFILDHLFSSILLALIGAGVGVYFLLRDSVPGK